MMLGGLNMETINNQNNITTVFLVIIIWAVAFTVAD